MVGCAGGGRRRCRAKVQMRTGGYAGGFKHGGDRLQIHGRLRGAGLTANFVDMAGSSKNSVLLLKENERP